MTVGANADRGENRSTSSKCAKFMLRHPKNSGTSLQPGGHYAIMKTALDNMVALLHSSHIV